MVLSMYGEPQIDEKRSRKARKSEQLTTRKKKMKKTKNIRMLHLPTPEKLYDLSKKNSF